MADEVLKMLKKRQEEWNTTHAAEEQIKKQITEIRSNIKKIESGLANLTEAAGQRMAKGVNPENAKKRIDQLNDKKTELEGKLKSLQDELKSLHAKKGGARRTRRTRRTRTRRSRRQ